MSGDKEWVIFFEIKESKINEYVDLYKNKPRIAYLKLCWQCLKFFFKTEKGKSALCLNRRRFNIAIEINGGIGDVLFGFQYALAMKRKLKEVLGDEFDLYVFTPLPEQVTDDIFFRQEIGREKIKNLKLLDERKFDLVLALRLLLPRVIFYKDRKEGGTFIKQYINNLQEIERRVKGIWTNDRQLNQLQYMLARGLNRITVLDITRDIGIKDDLNLICSEKGEDIYAKYPKLSTNNFVTISRGVDKNNKYKDSTRLWSVERYEEFLKQFKKSFPNIDIVYLGANKKSCESLNGVDVDLVGKTSMTELMVLLRDAQLHIDMECGMVHLRHFLCRKPSVVLFGPTSPTLKGYKENINIRKDKICSLPMCEHVILNDQWPKNCLKSDDCRGACVEAIKPDEVIKIIQERKILNDEMENRDFASGGGLLNY